VASSEMLEKSLKKEKFFKKRKRGGYQDLTPIRD
jgi:hypothetical protein